MIQPATPEGPGTWRAHPAFRQVVEHEARQAREFFIALPVGDKWLFADRGRFVMGIVCLVLAAGEALTAANLTQLCQARNVGSAGRCRKYVSPLLQYGLVHVLPGQGH